MVRKPLVVVMVMSLFVAVAWMAAPGRSGFKDFKIGVVDVSKCFEKYNRVQDEKASLEAYVKKQKDKAKAMEEEYTLLKNDLKNLRHDATNTRKQLITKLKQLEATLQVEAKFAESAYTDMYSDAQINMYNDIRNVINKIAQEQGFDLVLKSDEPLLDLNSEESVSRRINSRSVLSWNASFDITEEVIKRVNAEYKK